MLRLLRSYHRGGARDARCRTAPLALSASASSVPVIAELRFMRFPASDVDAAPDPEDAIL